MRRKLYLSSAWRHHPESYTDAHVSVTFYMTVLGQRVVVLYEKNEYWVPMYCNVALTSSYQSDSSPSESQVGSSQSTETNCRSNAISSLFTPTQYASATSRTLHPASSRDFSTECRPSKRSATSEGSPVCLKTILFNPIHFSFGINGGGGWMPEDELCWEGTRRMSRRAQSASLFSTSHQMSLKFPLWHSWYLLDSTSTAPKTFICHLVQIHGKL